MPVRTRMMRGVELKAPERYTPEEGIRFEDDHSDLDDSDFDDSSSDLSDVTSICTGMGCHLR